MASKIGYAARCECSDRTWEDVAKRHETPSSDAIRGKEIGRRRRLEALVIFRSPSSSSSPLRDIKSDGSISNHFIYNIRKRCGMVAFPRYRVA